ncbi:MAG: hypothetical protein K6G42_10705 [Lachnospiraceae bacterium]|nr:hypothetical protein [Lachnospiraceae bacterium]
MLYSILIIIGIIMIVIGLIGLINLAIEPIRKAYMVVFKRKDDYLFYEKSREGRALLASEMHAIKTVSVAFIVVGTICLAAGMFIKYVPHGTGTEAGAAHAEGIDGQGIYWMEEVPYEHYIRVRGTAIEFGGNKIADIDALGEELDTVDSSKTVLLLDDYASAGVFHEVQDLLKEKGIDSVEKEE